MATVVGEQPLKRLKKDARFGDDNASSTPTTESVTATTIFNVAADGTVSSPVVDPPPPGLYVSEGQPDSSCIAVGGFDTVTEKHIEAYVDQGYMLVRDGLAPSTVEAALEAIDRICREEDHDFSSACHPTDIEAAHNGLDVPGIQFEASGAQMAKGSRADFVRKLKNFHKCNKVLRAISYDAKMMTVVSRLMHGWPISDPAGVDIFQALALLKPPFVGREKPWHQDNAYFNVALNPSRSGAPTPIVGIWIALDEATPENGCMYIMPGQHKKPLLHWQRRDWQICDDQIHPSSLAVPMKPGDVLFFSSLLPHGTPPNLSNKRRRAIQYHMIPKNHPRCSTQDRLDVFGGQGKTVEC